MKKIILGATALIMCVALAGCGSTTSAITSLENQLDETANTISSIQSVNPSDISLTQSMLEGTSSTSDSDEIYNNSQNTQQSLATEEFYKMDILNKTAKIKNNLSKDLKLSKAQISAVNDLTNSLNRYTNSVAYSKNEMDNTVKSISTMKKNVDKNSDKINAKLNRLMCNSNARSTYYQNILNTLDQIETYVGCEDCKNDTYSYAENNHEQNFAPQKNMKKFDMPAPEKSENVAEDVSNDIFNSNNINRLGGYGMNGGYLPNGANGVGYGAGYGAPYGINRNVGRNGLIYNSNGAGYGYGANGYGVNNYGADGYTNYGANGYGANGYGANGYGANGYGANGYGVAYNRLYGTRFNPNRNTDTYAPLMRNIDTYQMNEIDGLSGVVVTTEPEQRLEDFEKLNEDNTVEKVKENHDLEKENDEQEITQTALAIEKYPRKEKIKTDKNNNDDNQRVVAYKQEKIAENEQPNVEPKIAIQNENNFRGQKPRNMNEKHGDHNNENLDIERADFTGLQNERPSRNFNNDHQKVAQPRKIQDKRF